MVDQEPPRGTPGKTDLTLKEWRFLNRFSEKGSPLWERQLKKIDELRGKYPADSPAQLALNVFDHRTGVAQRNIEILNQALELDRKGKTQEAEALMRQLVRLGDRP